MGVKEFVVAIELGTSRISGLAGRKGADGSLQILAYATEDASSCIRKGVIYNIEKAALALNSIINKLEETLKSSIARVYVGVSGQSLRTVRHSITRHLGEETCITATIENELIAADYEAGISVDQTILDVIPQEYRVDSGLQADPVGVMSKSIEGRFLNVMSRASVKHKIERSFEKAKIEIAGYLVSPVWMARVALTDAERRSGCVLVDMGADTTTIQIYKDSILRHLVVLPLGGNNITKDICSLQIEEHDAEELKVTRASAYTSTEAAAQVSDTTITFGEHQSVSLGCLNDVVSARCEEIIANVWHQVRLSGYDDKLLSGIILTGGASNMRGLVEAFVHKTGVEKVRLLPILPVVLHGSHKGFPASDARSATLLGLLAAGEEDCSVPETKVPVTAEDEKRAVTGELFMADGESREAAREAEKLQADAELATRQAEDNAVMSGILQPEKDDEVASSPNDTVAEEQNKEWEQAKARAAKEQAENEKVERMKKEAEKARARETFFGGLGRRIAVISKKWLEDEE